MYPGALEYSSYTKPALTNDLDLCGSRAPSLQGRQGGWPGLSSRQVAVFSGCCRMKGRDFGIFVGMVVQGAFLRHPWALHRPTGHHLWPHP